MLAGERERWMGEEKVRTGREKGKRGAGERVGRRIRGKEGDAERRMRREKERTEQRLRRHSSSSYLFIFFELLMVNGPDLCKFGPIVRMFYCRFAARVAGCCGSRRRRRC